MKEFVRKVGGSIIFASVSQAVAYGREIGTIPSIATGTRVNTEDLVSAGLSAAVALSGNLAKRRMLGAEIVEDAGLGGLTFSAGKIISKLWVKAIAGV